MFERFQRRFIEYSDPDPADTFYDDIDEETARNYDADLVEFGLMTEAEFNQLYPERPFIPEVVAEPPDSGA